MDYPVLITTAMKAVGNTPYGQPEQVSAALNTLVVEFPTRDAAEIAVGNINRFRNSSVSQYATRLYKEL
jgi:hypothetical protein